MAIDLKIDKDFNTDSFCDIHSIPCKVHYNGVAKVSDFFKTSFVDDSEQRASFRGCPLDGKKVVLPDNYAGLVFREKDKPIVGSRNFTAVHGFQSLMFWNWDKKPSLNDPFLSALDWMEISEAVHSPLEEDKI